MLDEEELETAGRTTSGLVGRAVQDIEEEGRRFPEATRGEIEDFVTAEALMRLLDLARNRLGAGDFRGAARSCVNVIGIGGTLTKPEIFAVQEAWLLLAEIHAEYGDFRASRGFLQTADQKVEEELERLSQQGRDGATMSEAYQKEWKARVAPLHRRVK